MIFCIQVVGPRGSFPRGFFRLALSGNIAFYLFLHILRINTLKMSAIHQKLEEIPFENKACKEAVRGMLKTVPYAEARKRKSTFAQIIHQISQMFPEDREKIETLFTWEETERKTGSTVRLRKDVFSNRTVEKGKKDCPTCPENLFEEIDEAPSGQYLNSTKTEKKAPQDGADLPAKEDLQSAPGRPGEEAEGIDDGEGSKEGISSQEAEEEDFQLPEDLYEEKKGKTVETVETVDDIETIEDAKIFFDYGNRPAEDIINEIRMQLDAAGFSYSANAKRAEKYIEYYVEYLKS